MTTDIYTQVGEFRSKMALPIGAAPQFLSAAETSYFARFILEELSEYLRATEEGLLIDAADALVDLVYVTLGCAHAMGLPFNEMFAAVHKANMQKQPANQFVRSQRGSQYDVVKPFGWVGPEDDIARLIRDSQSRHQTSAKMDAS